MYYASFKTGTYLQLKCFTPALSSNVVHKFNCLHDANCSYEGQSISNETFSITQVCNDW